MSSEAVVQATSDGIAVNYVFISAFALLVYDSILTLSQEVRFIWKKKFKIGTALYILARYPTLVYIFTQVLSNFVNFPSIQQARSCNALDHLAQAVFILHLIGDQGLLLARAYAVTDHKKAVLIVLLLVSGCSMAPELTGEVLNTCNLTSAQLHILLIIFGILFDTIVVVVTLSSTLGTWRVYKRSTWNRLSLAHLLARQSLIRFGIVLTLSIATTIIPVTVRPTLEAVLKLMANSLSTIIICRFHLDLQQRNARLLSLNMSTLAGLPTISVGTFHAATQKLHLSLMEEFGDEPTVKGTEAAQETIATLGPDDVPGESTPYDIELEEIQSRSQSASVEV